MTELLPLAALCADACRTSFKDVGKGWYNLAESNFEAYRFSKLRRFLGLVRFGMEDTLRFLVEGSIAKFVTFMQVGAGTTTAHPAGRPAAVS